MAAALLGAADVFDNINDKKVQNSKELFSAFLVVVVRCGFIDVSCLKRGICTRVYVGSLI